MSLLDGGARYESCTVYPQEIVTDIAGNPRTQPSTTGTAAVARFQPMMQVQAGTSATLQEQDSKGFESTEVYAMRFPRGVFENLGPQSEIEWGLDVLGRPKRWAVQGFPLRYNGSAVTAHVSYNIKRC